MDGGKELTERPNRPPPQRLLNHRAYVRQAVLVLERGQPIASDDGVELRLCTGGDIRIQGHREDEVLEGAEGLWVGVSVKWRFGWEGVLTVSAPADA